MADFCMQCSIELFGEDYGDFANQITEEDQHFIGLCEGCGWIKIDWEGRCIDEKCLKHQTESTCYGCENHVEKHEDGYISHLCKRQKVVLKWSMEEKGFAAFPKRCSFYKLKDPNKTKAIFSSKKTFVKNDS